MYYKQRLRVTRFRALARGCNARVKFIFNQTKITHTHTHIDTLENGS